MSLDPVLVRGMTVFGATLLYDETCETFTWLFNYFMKAISDENLMLSSQTKILQ